MKTLSLFMTLIMLLLLSSCLSEVSEDQESCQSYEVFDSKTKSCVNILFGDNSSLGLSFASNNPSVGDITVYKDTVDADVDFSTVISAPAGVSYSLKWFINGVEKNSWEDEKSPSFDSDNYDVGVYKIEAIIFNDAYTVEEDSLTWDITVSYPHVTVDSHTPVLTNYTMYSGNTTSHVVTGTDLYSVGHTTKWFINGVEISGATSDSYVFDPTDLGLPVGYHALSVRFYSTADSSFETYDNFTWGVTLENAPYPVVGLDQSVSLTEDSPSSSFDLNEATDNRGLGLIYTKISDVSHGVLTNCLDGTSDFQGCIYTPNANFYGTDTLTYKVNDTVDDSLGIATVTFTVASGADADLPTTTAISSIEAVEDTEVVVTLDAISNESTLTSCTLSSLINITETTACSCVDGICSVGVTPDTDLNDLNSGPFTFEYYVTDSIGDSATVSAALTVSPVSDLPTISTDASCTTSFDQDTPFTCATNPVGSDTDTGETGMSHKFEILKSNAGDCGSWLTISDAAAVGDDVTGTFVGNPTDDDVGGCLLRYRVCDESDSCSIEKSISLTVTNVDPILDLSESTQTVINEGGSGIILADSEVTADEEGYGTYSLITPSSTPYCSAYGTTSIDSATGAVSLDLTDSEFSGDCYVKVQFDDGNGGSSASDEKSITITNVNDDAPKIGELSSSSIIITSDEASVNFTADEDSSGIVGEDAETLSIVIQYISGNSSLFPLSQVYANDGGTTDVYATVSDTTATFTDASIDDGSSDAGTKIFELNFVPAGGETGTATFDVWVNDGVNSSTKNRLELTVYSLYSTHNGWSSIRAQGPIYNRYNTKETDSNISFSWPTMSVTNSSVDSTTYKWFIFRNEGSAVSDTSITSTQKVAELDFSTLSYTDTGLASGISYYYKVVPFATEDNATWNIPVTLSNGSSDFTDLKITVPPDNMVLVHRWMANIDTCTEMGIETDSSKNYACTYTGKGGTGSLFDVGSDRFVDRYEMGCPYGLPPACPETGGDGCIGTEDPITAGIDATALDTSGSFYYDRTSATCYLASGGNWSDVDGANMTSIALKEIPPLVMVNKTEATASCTNRIALCDGVVCPSASGGFMDGKSISLPSRTDQIVFSKWNSGLSQSDAKILTTGGDLTLNSLCNSDSDNGLTYFDTLPVADMWSSLPGTGDGSVRSVNTGSDLTASCISRYGVQDAVGNVREWSSSDSFNGSVPAYGPSINFDGTTGNGIVLTVGKTTGVSYIHYPWGLPMYNDAAEGTVTFSDSSLGYYVEDATAATNVLLFGGGWDSSTYTSREQVGRFSFDAVKDIDKGRDIGFRCMIK